MPAEYSPPESDAANFDFGPPLYYAPQPTEADFNFRPLALIYNIIGGSLNYFTAIWADANAGREAGKFYVASPNALSVVDLERKVLDDYYDQTHQGRFREELDSNDIKDINITRS